MPLALSYLIQNGSSSGLSTLICRRPPAPPRSSPPVDDPAAAPLDAVAAEEGELYIIQYKVDTMRTHVEGGNEHVHQQSEQPCSVRNTTWFVCEVQLYNHSFIQQMIPTRDAMHTPQINSHIIAAVYSLFFHSHLSTPELL